MARFSPDSPVLATVTMTRTAYAQLMGQKFHPTKAFGQFKEKEGSPEWRWRDIGMKIVSISVSLYLSLRSLILPQACGFEMVYQETGSQRDTNADRLDRAEASVRTQ
jgi:SGT1 protein